MNRKVAGLFFVVLLLFFAAFALRHTRTPAPPQAREQQATIRFLARSAARSSTTARSPKPDQRLPRPKLRRRVSLGQADTTQPSIPSPHPKILLNPPPRLLRRTTASPVRATARRAKPTTPKDKWGRYKQKLTQRFKAKVAWLGELPDGSRLATLSQPRRTQGGHETPETFQLQHVDEQGQSRRLARKLKLSTVYLAKESGHLALVTASKMLHLSGAMSKGPYAQIATRVGYLPTLNPAGTILVYARYTSPHLMDLMRYDRETGRTQVLVKGHMGLGSPRLSPDQREVLFVSNESGIASFWKISIDGGTPKQLTNRGIRPGTGLSQHFVPVAQEGKLLWSKGWIVYHTGNALWALQDNGKVARLLTRGTLRWFRWQKIGEAVTYSMADERIVTVNLPTSQP